MQADMAACISKQRTDRNHLTGRYDDSHCRTDSRQTFEGLILAPRQ